MNKETNGQDIYLQTKSNPTTANKQLFLLNHRKYIFTIVARMLKTAHPEDIEDYCSSIYEILLRRGNLDFNRSYPELKGYISLTSQRTLNQILRRSKFLTYETKIEDWQWNNLHDYNDVNNDFKKNIIDELLLVASKKELIILKKLLKGLTYAEIAKAQKCTIQNIRRIIKTFSEKYKDRYKRLKE